jgi:hypothetical protein
MKREAQSALDELRRVRNQRTGKATCAHCAHGDMAASELFVLCMLRVESKWMSKRETCDAWELSDEA